MKKFIMNLLIILTAFIIYFLQANFFNWVTISGVMPSLFVIFVLFIGLFSNRITGVVYGVVIGGILDLVIGTQIGIYAVGLGIIGFLSATFDKNFSKSYFKLLISWYLMKVFSKPSMDTRQSHFAVRMFFSFKYPPPVYT